MFSIELGVQYMEPSSDSAGWSVPWYFGGFLGHPTMPG